MEKALEIVNPASYKGFIKIWKTHKETGESTLLVDQPNMILHQGADILAKALAGVKYSGISHIYVGYCNDVAGTFTPPIIDKAYTNRFQDFGSPFGYLRLPLAFPTSFLTNSVSYDANVGIYTVVVSSAVPQGGAAFQSTSPPSWIYEIALVSSQNPSNDSADKVFSRANFTPIKYELNYNLTVSWGVQFIA